MHRIFEITFRFVICTLDFAMIHWNFLVSVVLELGAMVRLEVDATVVRFVAGFLSGKGC